MERRRIEKNTTCRVPPASGNQGKLEGIFPVREKSGNLAFFQKSGKNQGILMTQYFFIYFNNIVYFTTECIDYCH